VELAEDNAAKPIARMMMADFITPESCTGDPITSARGAIR
jgi:hypothetical protein